MLSNVVQTLSNTVERYQTYLNTFECSLNIIECHRMLSRAVKQIFQTLSNTFKPYQTSLVEFLKRKSKPFHFLIYKTRPEITRSPNPYVESLFRITVNCEMQGRVSPSLPTLRSLTDTWSDGVYNTD